MFFSEVPFLITIFLCIYTFFHITFWRCNILFPVISIVKNSYFSSRYNVLLKTLFTKFIILIQLSNQLTEPVSFLLQDVWLWATQTRSVSLTIKVHWSFSKTTYKKDITYIGGLHHTSFYFRRPKANSETIHKNINSLMHLQKYIYNS